MILFAGFRLPPAVFHKEAPVRRTDLRWVTGVFSMSLAGWSAMLQLGIVMNWFEEVFQGSFIIKK